MEETTEISLRIDPNDKDLVTEITSRLDTNAFSYEERELVDSFQAEGGTVIPLAHFIIINLRHFISAWRYIEPIIHNYFKNNKHSPIEIHYGDKSIKVSSVDDLEPAFSTLKKMSSLK